MTTQENKSPSSTSPPPPKAFKAVFPLVLAIVGTILMGLGVATWWRTKTTAPSHKGEPTETISLENGEILPDLEFYTEDQKPVRLSEALATRKLILLNFWASWCQACLIEMPALGKARAMLAPLGFEIFAVNVDENPKIGIEKTRKRIEIPFPIWIDKDGEISEKMDIHAIPVSIIINQKREILWTVYGEREWDSDDTIEKLKAYLQ